jgi:hypothetical protein
VSPETTASSLDEDLLAVDRAADYDLFDQWTTCYDSL